MPATINQRVAASIDGDFVVFLIGARINKWWKPHRYIPVARAMRRMIAELQAHPEMGLLHVESWSGRTAIMVQYWRSFEHLHAYAWARDAAHLPAQSRQRERADPGNVANSAHGGPRHPGRAGWHPAPAEP